ncbi:hypothetical protein GCM10009119_38900 [Algoriphagus jejuensis]|uniref:Lipopolysaccharide biosynthesis protein n=1 Tax=Algoriphagus jejuensis TaxID=419934 RepID=A0ABN1N583_9BACT
MAQPQDDNPQQKVAVTETKSDRRASLQEDEILVKDLFLKIREWWDYLFNYWWIILLSGIVGASLGLVYSLSNRQIFTAEITFVLEEGDGVGVGGLSQYAGIASMAGVDLGGGGGGIFQGDNILELYKSRRMIQETLLAKDTFQGKEQLLIDRYIDFNNLREDWDKIPSLKDIRFDNSEKFTRTQDSIVGEFVDRINQGTLKVTKPDANLSIISVKVKSEDEFFAKSFADNIVDKVNNFYVKTKTKKSMENLSILQNQADSVREVLNASLGEVAQALDASFNLNPAYQTLRVASQKKQIDVQANSAIYQEIVKNLEMAKISFRNAKPLIQVIDVPVFPLKKERFGIAKGIVLGGVLFGIFAVVSLIARRVISQIIA